VPGLRSAVAAAALSVAAATAQAQDLRPALEAQVQFLDLAGAPVDAVEASDPVLLRVTIRSALADEPPKGLSLFGWLRPVGETDLPCEAAAESFLRTGRLPTGAIFLNDPVIGVVTEDAGFLVTDPDFSLATANILGAETFGSRPAALAADPDARRFLIALPDEGRVAAVDATGQSRTLVETGGRPTGVVPQEAGAALVLLEGGTLLRHDPTVGTEILAAGTHALRPLAQSAWAVALADTEASLLDPLGATTLRAPIPPAGDAAGLAEIEEDAPFALAVLGEREVAIRYLDAPDSPVVVPLPGPASRLSAAPGGRVLLAWDPRGREVHILDVGRSRVVHTIHAPTAVSEVAFSDRTAFLMLDTQTHVGALDLIALARGERAEFREIPIGTASEPAAEPRQLLAPLWPAEGMLAIHAETFQGYRLADSSVMGNAPAMTATSLRGGVPRLAATLDRSFAEVRPGVFETVASLPGAGRYELVTTTGLGALDFCAEVPVAAPAFDDAPQVEGLVAVAPAEAGSVRFRLTGAGGEPAAHRQGLATFVALGSGWSARARLETDAEGLTLQHFALPDMRPLVVRIDMAGADRFRTVLIEESP
jgi:hypothetical protein